VHDKVSDERQQGDTGHTRSQENSARASQSSSSSLRGGYIARRGEREREQKEGVREESRRNDVRTAASRRQPVHHLPSKSKQRGRGGREVRARKRCADWFSCLRAEQGEREEKKMTYERGERY